MIKAPMIVRNYQCFMYVRLLLKVDLLCGNATKVKLFNPLITIDHMRQSNHIQRVVYKHNAKIHEMIFDITDFLMSSKYL